MTTLNLIDRDENLSDTPVLWEPDDNNPVYVKNVDSGLNEIQKVAFNIFKLPWNIEFSNDGINWPESVPYITQAMIDNNYQDVGSFIGSSQYRIPVTLNSSLRTYTYFRFRSGSNVFSTDRVGPLTHTAFSTQNFYWRDNNVFGYLKTYGGALDYFQSLPLLSNNYLYNQRIGSGTEESPYEMVYNTSSLGLTSDVSYFHDGVMPTIAPRPSSVRFGKASRFDASSVETSFTIATFNVVPTHSNVTADYDDFVAFLETIQHPSYVKAQQQGQLDYLGVGTTNTISLSGIEYEGKIIQTMYFRRWSSSEQEFICDVGFRYYTDGTYVSYDWVSTLTKRVLLSSDNNGSSDIDISEHVLEYDEDIEVGDLEPRVAFHTTQTIKKNEGLAIQWPSNVPIDNSLNIVIQSHVKDRDFCRKSTVLSDNHKVVGQYFYENAESSSILAYGHENVDRVTYAGTVDGSFQHGASWMLFQNVSAAKHLGKAFCNRCCSRWP